MPSPSRFPASITYASGSYLISGGGVAWTGGLNFLVSSANYVIQGTEYTSPQATVTLSAADPADPRIDVIIVDDTRTASVVAARPPLTRASRHRPGVGARAEFIYVPAAASDATVSVEVIYRENLEWTTSQSGGTFTLASTNNPFAGTKDVEATAAANGHYVQFQAPSTFDPAAFNSLILQIRSKAWWPNQKSLSLTLRNAGTQRGTAVAFKTGLFAFDSSITSGYQQVVIPANSFAANGLPCNQLRISVTGGGANIGFYLDNLEWQSGVVVPSQSDRMRWRGNYDAATAYSKNDVVLSSGIQYVAIAPSVGQTPATAVTYWQPSSAAGGASAIFGIPSKVKNASHTIELADDGYGLDHEAAGGAGDTYTIPANASVALPVGFTFSAFNMAPEDLTVAITSDTLAAAGDGDIGPVTIEQYNGATFRKVSSTAGCGGAPVSPLEAGAVQPRP